MPLWHNIAELVDYYIPPLPQVYWIDIVRECNLKCVMCPQSRGLTPRTPKMPFELFQRIVDEVCETHPLLKLYLSGEPLLHERLFEMIAYAGSCGCRTMIHTNATRLTEEAAEKLLASSLTFLSFSFDGGAPDIYERLRPPAKFDLVQANILRYLELRRHYDRGPRTTIEIIHMRDTENLIPAFVAQWQARGVEEVRVVPYLTWHGLVDDRRTGNRPATPPFKPCAAVFQHGCVLSDGIVVPCCLDVNGRLPLGDITRSRFRDIWSANDYRSLRLQMLTGTLPCDSICLHCDNTIREEAPPAILSEGPRLHG